MSGRFDEQTVEAYLLVVDDVSGEQARAATRLREKTPEVLPDS